MAGKIINKNIQSHLLIPISLRNEFSRTTDTARPGICRINLTGKECSRKVWQDATNVKSANPNKKESLVFFFLYLHVFATCYQSSFVPA
jgi:hypothetical protein